jgi:hypothetical protein
MDELRHESGCRLDCSDVMQGICNIYIYTSAFQLLWNAKWSSCLDGLKNLIESCSQVYLPKDAVHALIVSSIGDVTILPGFATPALKITSGTVMETCTPLVLIPKTWSQKFPGETPAPNGPLASKARFSKISPTAA